MQIAFEIYQWMYSDIPINSDFTDLIEYSNRNIVEIVENEILITGRAFLDFKAGDALYTKSGSAFEVRRFFLYGKELDFISANCTCGIKTSIIDEELLKGMYLYLKIV